MAEPSQQHPELGPPEGESSTLPIDATDELIASMGAFDAAHEAFLDTCASYATGPTDDRFIEITGAVTKVSSDFRDYLEAITTGEIPLGEQITLIGQVLIEKDESLNTMFAQLTECPDFFSLAEAEQFKAKLIAKLQKKAMKARDSSHFANKVLDIYLDMVQEDLNHFTKDVRQKTAGKQLHPEEEEEDDVVANTAEYTKGSRTRHIAQEVGKHALGTAKIAIGVALGIWATRNITRN